MKMEQSFPKQRNLDRSSSPGKKRNEIPLFGAKLTFILVQTLQTQRLATLKNKQLL
jgi:hypothetical protein